MAIKESALSLITSIAQGDWVRAVTSAGASRRVTVANLAKAIVESYTGSSLAGSAQSVKSAIDSLNSKTGLYNDTSASTISELLLGKFNYVKANGNGCYLLSGGWAAHDFGFSFVWVQSSTRGIVIFFSSDETYHGYINNGAITAVRKYTETRI